MARQRPSVPEPGWCARTAPAELVARSALARDVRRRDRGRSLPGAYRAPGMGAA